MNKILFGLMATILSASVHAFELMELPQREPNTVTVMLEGPYDQKSLKMIRDLVKYASGQRLIVYANSPGGYANDLPKIMDTIYGHGNVTWINSGLCASACAWSAVSARQPVGKFHFHGISFGDGRGLTPTGGLDLSSRMFQYGVKRAELSWYGKELVEVEF